MNLTSSGRVSRGASMPPNQVRSRSKCPVRVVKLPGKGTSLLRRKVAKDLAGVAHSIGTTVAYLTSPGAGAAIGAETMQQFIAAGQGLTPSPLVTANTDGSLTMGNGSGDAVTLQPPANNTISENVTLGSDGALVPPADAPAVSAELAADGAGTVFENTSSQTIDALSGSTSHYATAAAPGGGSGQVVVLGRNERCGATQPSLSTHETRGGRGLNNSPSEA